MKKVLLPLFIGFCASLNAQHVVDFEDLQMSADTFYNGIDGTTEFNSENFVFPVTYDTAWGGYWASGFAMSTMTDTATGDATNLYSAYTASPGNNAYAVANVGAGPVTLNSPVVFEQEFVWESVQITNGTYAYKSMLNGDLFAKKFGGATGDDPDYFFIRIVAEGSGGKDSLDFYLADFRFTDNTQDYIIDDWTEVDLTSLPTNSTSLTFQMFSSDTGLFGINTPLFFALDDLTYDLLLSVEDVEANESPLVVYDMVQAQYVVQVTESTQLKEYDLSGRLLTEVTVLPGTHYIPSSAINFSVVSLTSATNQTAYKFSLPK